MSIHTLFIYLIASIILFFLLNIYNSKKKETIHYIIITAIYLLFLAGLCTSLHLTKNNDTIFLVFIFELLIRIFYTTAIKEMNFFQSKEEVKKYLLTFLIIFALNTFFISKAENVFLTVEQTKVVIWLLIIIYIIKEIAKEKENKNEVVIEQKTVQEQKQEYIIIQYAKFKTKYSKSIKTKFSKLIPIIYGIMIYENKNRPKLFRKLDYYYYRFDNKARKFGIMQIYYKYYIDDETSISIAIKKLEKILYRLPKNKQTTNTILKEYYKKDNIVKVVNNIVKEIKMFEKK